MGSTKGIKEINVLTLVVMHPGHDAHHHVRGAPPPVAGQIVTVHDHDAHPVMLSYHSRKKHAIQDVPTQIIQSLGLYNFTGH